MLLAQITDPHLRDDGADPRHDPAAALRRAFAGIAQMDMRPDAVVLTGDIIDRSAAGYDHVLPLLREAPVPLLPMPGNHDRAAEFRAAFAGWADFARDHLSFTRAVGGALLVALDSTMPDGGGGVDAARLGWLQRALDTAAAPVVLALHHPPFPTHVPHLDRSGFAGAGDLARLITGSRVCRLVAGHSHRAIQTTWAGIPASTAPAIGHGLTLSLTGKHAHTPSDAPPGFELLHLRSGVMVSHLIAVT